MDGWVDGWMTGGRRRLVAWRQIASRRETNMVDSLMNGRWHFEREWFLEAVVIGGIGTVIRLVWRRRAFRFQSWPSSDAGGTAPNPGASGSIGYRDLRQKLEGQGQSVTECGMDRVQQGSLTLDGEDGSLGVGARGYPGKLYT